MTFRAQPLDQQGNLLDVPGYDCVVQHGQATEGVKLILEFTPVQPAFLAETEEARQVVGRLALVAGARPSAQENTPAPSALPTADSGSAISSSEVRSALTPNSATTTTVNISSAAANRFP